MRAAELREERVREQRNVDGALAQRRQHDADRVDPIEEVVAEAAVAHRRREVLVRRGDDARVHLDLLRPAHAEKGALLECAEQLPLHLRLESADLRP